MKEELNFPFLGNERRYKMWEKESVKITNTIHSAEQELGVSLPESLQHFDGDEITPEKAIDIDDRALRNKDCPNIVFGRPHGGEYVPSDLWNNATTDGKKTLCVIDRGTSEIFKSEKIPSVGTKISRFIADPNRPPLPGMKTEGSSAPGEVLWKRTITGVPMFNEGATPANEEIEDISERFYLPYYNAMMATVGSLADRRENERERVLVIDGHSFPISDITKPYFKETYNVDDPNSLSLFVLGDEDKLGEVYCDQDIRDAFVGAIEDNFKQLPEKTQCEIMGEIKGGIIGLNHPFRGVRNVKFFGRRKEGVSSFQLELNEATYVDENGGDYYNASYKKDNLIILKKLIEKTCLDINPILKSK